MELLDFEEFLKQKKIDPLPFQQGEPAVFEEFRNIYVNVNPESFTAQKLFMINRIRRRYPYADKPAGDRPASPGIVKPKMPFKPKIS